MNALLPTTTTRLPLVSRVLPRLPLLGTLWIAAVAACAADGWQNLFDGRSLAGWTANEQPGSFQVVDGSIVCNGPRSHLFYTGPIEGGRFRNFEFEAEVLARPGANSGVYFHTAFQDKDWPTRGYEVQVNGSATGEGNYRENKRTGSLYGIRNVYRTLVPDDRWFVLRIRVLGRRVTLHVDDVATADYVEPENAPNGGYRDRRLDEGTFALQCHDPGSRVLYRKIRVRPLPASEVDATPVPDRSEFRISPELATLHANNFPVVDLHTHLKGGLTLEDVLRRQFRTGINAGIAVNGGLGFPITNDAGLDRALAEIRHPLVYRGLQGEGREWPKLFSPEAIARFDYVFTDAMTFTDDRGRRMRLWIPEEVHVDDPEAFMDLLVRRTVAILENEPIQIWVNPTFLPAVLAPRYEELWTEARMRTVIDAAVRRGIAIEINDRFRLPGAAFVRLAKKAGARFT
ncbi:MAG: DUF1080 domain-containing protein, partial [Verrucomicrobiales bacterium]|nr:DUF1080 domain-containing protein [Verrucomicrobiales bacterium]